MLPGNRPPDEVPRWTEKAIMRAMVYEGVRVVSLTSVNAISVGGLSQYRDDSAAHFVRGRAHSVGQ